MYYRHGLIHRDPKQGPARIERNDSDTALLIESYYVNNEPYRDPADDPHYIERCEDGRTECEYYSDATGVRSPRRPTRRAPRWVGGLLRESGELVKSYLGSVRRAGEEDDRMI